MRKNQPAPAESKLVFQMILARGLWNFNDGDSPDERKLFQLAVGGLDDADDRKRQRS